MESMMLVPTSKKMKNRHFPIFHACRVVVVDAQTFLIPNFTYDGQAPDAHFWVGQGNRPGPEVTIQTRQGKWKKNIKTCTKNDPHVGFNHSLS